MLIQFSDMTVEIMSGVFECRMVVRAMNLKMICKDIVGQVVQR